MLSAACVCVIIIHSQAPKWNIQQSTGNYWKALFPFMHLKCHGKGGGWLRVVVNNIWATKGSAWIFCFILLCLLNRKVLWDSILSSLVSPAIWASLGSSLGTSDPREGGPRLYGCSLWSCRVHTDPRAGCVSLCHVSHRSGSDGGWFVGMQTPKEKLPSSVAGPIRWRGYLWPSYPVVSKLSHVWIFLFAHQYSQQCNNLHHSSENKQITDHRIHKQSASRRQHTTLYLTVCPSATLREQACAQICGFCTCDVCPLSSSSSAQTFMFFFVFVSDRVGRSTAANVEVETAAEDVNVSQRRVPG